MRRQQTSVGLSPKVIKHMVAVTIGCTLLLALFANGEQSEVKAALQDRAKKNQLLAAQANKIGDKKLEKIWKPEREAADEDPGFERLNERNRDANEGVASVPQSNAALGPPPPPAPGGGDWQMVPVPPGPDGKPTNQWMRVKKKPKQQIPTAAQKQSIEAASRARSGRATPAD